MFAFLQSAIILIISLIALAAAVYALIHAARVPEGAFKAAGKQSKLLWVGVMAVSAVIAFISLPWPLGNGGGPLGLIGLVSLIAVIYYIVDVKPKVSGFSGGPSAPRNNNRGTW